MYLNVLFINHPNAIGMPSTCENLVAAFFQRLWEYIFRSTRDLAFTFASQELASLTKSKGCGIYSAHCGESDVLEELAYTGTQPLHQGLSIESALRLPSLDNVEFPVNSQIAFRFPANRPSGTLKTSLVIVIEEPEATAMLASLKKNSQSFESELHDVLETIELIDLYRDLKIGVSNATSLDDLLSAMLIAFAKLTGAAFGHFSIWIPRQNSPTRGDLQIMAEIDNGKISFDRQKIDTPYEIVKRLWNDPLDCLYLVEDVSTIPSIYFNQYKGVQSEIAIRWSIQSDSTTQDKMLGIVDLQAKNAGAFSDNDFYSVEAIFDFVSELLTELGKFHLLDPIGVTISRRGSSDQILHKIAQYASSAFSFRSSIIYSVDHARRRFRARHVIGADVSSITPKAFSYTFDQTSFAGKIMAERKACLAMNPLSDHSASRKGVITYGIGSPMIGVPLCGKLSKTVSAILVLWNFTGNEKDYASLALKLDKYSIFSGGLLHYSNEMESEAFRYHSLLQTLPAAVFCKSLDHRFLFANRAFCDALNLSINEVLGKTDAELYPDDMDLVNKYQSDDEAAQLTMEGELVTEPNIFIDKTGKKHYRIVQVCKRQLRNQTNVILGIEGLYLPFNSSIEGAVEGHYVSTEFGRFVYLNKALADMLEYDSVTAAYNTEISDLYADPGARELFIQDIRKGNGSVKDRECRLKTRTGKSITISENAQEIPSKNSRYPAGDSRTYFQGTIVDVSVRKLFEKKLGVAAIAATLVHDVQGYFVRSENEVANIEALLLRLRQNDQFEQTIAQIKERCSKISAPNAADAIELHKLLELAKGNVPINAVRQDIIPNIIGWCRAAECAKPRSLRIDITHSDPSIMAEYVPSFLGIAFHQLLWNCTSRTNRMIKCNVNVTACERFVTITVEDDGPGFGLKDRILSGWRGIIELQRMQGVGTGKNGLGLVITHSIMELMGGNVSLSDLGPFGGARVTLQIPS